MKIYTKKGDQGQTSLFGGKRLPKNEIRIDTYGTLDELNAHIGVLRDNVKSTEVHGDLIKIQEEIFTLGSWIASEPEKVEKLKLPVFEESNIDWLEEKMDEMDKDLPEMKSFILPGGHQTVSFCHVARCVCRNAERKMVALNQVESLNPIHLKYINRLSDYFFVLSRRLSHDLKAQETPWQPFN